MLIKDCEVGKIYNIKAHKGGKTVSFCFMVEYQERGKMGGYDIPEASYERWNLSHDAFQGHYELKKITRKENPEYFL